MRRLCLALTLLALSLGGLTFTPAPSEGGPLCPHYFCRTDRECEDLCPEAAAAGCVDNVCYYNY